jgi:hypothetical protein
MGCDFTFIIQVLYGKTWIPIVHFDTKTPCFGHPLTSASVQAYVREGVCGDVDLNNAGIQSLSEKEKILVAMGLKDQDPNQPTSASGAVSAPPFGMDPGVFATMIESIRQEEEDTALYYSREQLEKLLPYIDTLEEDTYNAHLYNRMMAPVPMWMDMAKTAYPLFKGGSIWMYDDQSDIDGLTVAIKEHQGKLTNAYKHMLLLQLSRRGPFPSHLVILIAEYASPVASDVRFLWSEDEGHCRKLRRHYLKKKQTTTPSS